MCVFPGLIQACAGALPSYMVLDVAEVLWEFLTFCRQVRVLFNFSVVLTVPRCVGIFVLITTSQNLAPVFLEWFLHV